MMVEAHLRAICQEVEAGVYHQRMVKDDRIVYFIGPEHPDAVAGRCGPVNCALLCEGFKFFEATGAGKDCVCKNE